MIKTILFDLDGTLLPMNQDVFVKSFVIGVAKKSAEYGRDPSKFAMTMKVATDKMIKNDGTKTNEEVFWDCYLEEFGKDAYKDKVFFESYYENEYQEVKECCGYNEYANKIIKLAKEKGYRIVLATNPVFPKVAVISRLEWAGVDYRDFEYITSFENSRYSKPNIEYYKDILKEINCDAKECLMIGNDVRDDMIVREIGMETFLLTECLINEENKDLNEYNNGTYKDLFKYIEEI